MYTKEYKQGVEIQKEEKLSFNITQAMVYSLNQQWKSIQE